MNLSLDRTSEIPGGLTFGSVLIKIVHLRIEGDSNFGSVPQYLAQCLPIVQKRCH